MREAVVLVHGLWSNGIDLWRIRGCLKRAGYECHVFNYHVWGRPPAKIAQALNRFVQRIDAPAVHFVGHSFGGVVILHLFDQFSIKKNGRIVLMATPVNGSAVGRRLARRPIANWILGRSSERGLGGDVPEWKGEQDIGVIAGTVQWGMGMIMGGQKELPHDGTVALSEARLKGATDFIALPVSHSGMLMSSLAAEQVVAFLREGGFDSNPVKDAAV